MTDDHLDADDYDNLEWALLDHELQDYQDWLDDEYDRDPLRWLWY